MIKSIRRGEIYLADLNPHRGSEQGGLRPVLILQNNIGNSHSPTTIIAPISNKYGRDYLPVHVKLNECDGLDESSNVLLEQIRVIDKQRLKKYPCSLTGSTMELIDQAVLISCGIHERIV